MIVGKERFCEDVEIKDVREKKNFWGEVLKGSV